MCNQQHLPRQLHLPHIRFLNYVGWRERVQVAVFSGHQTGVLTLNLGTPLSVSQGRTVVKASGSLFRFLIPAFRFLHRR